MRLAAAALLSAALAIPQIASAQRAPTLGYVELRLGAYTPRHDDMDAFDTGLNGEVALGKMLGPNFALEGAVGYFRSTASSSYYDPYYGATYSEDVTLSVVPVTGSLRAIISSGPLSFSGLAGVGVYFASVKDAVSDPSGSYSATDDDTFFGFHVGAGAAVKVAPRASLGLDLRYLIGKVSVFGGSGHIDGLRTSAALIYDF